MIFIIILVVGFIIAIPLGIASGVGNIKKEKEDAIFKKEVLKNMKK